MGCIMDAKKVTAAVRIKIALSRHRLPQPPQILLKLRHLNQRAVGTA